MTGALSSIINQLNFYIMSKSNYDIAHEFAYGATEGHTGNWNLFIEGDCIYSYGHHFCIAKRVGKGSVLLTTRTYSISTAKHIRYVWNATGHMDHIYCYDPDASHAENQRRFLEEIKDLLPHLAKARKPEIWIHMIQVISERAKKYCEFFGIKMEKDLAMFVQSEDLNKTNEAYEAELKRRAFREHKLLMKKKREQLEKWHNFEGSDYVSGLDYQELRLNKANKNRIETTMDVEIPFEVAREFYEKLKSGAIKVGDKLFYYVVRRMDSKEIAIGCHTFKRRYLMDFGKRVFC